MEENIPLSQDDGEGSSGIAVSDVDIENDSGELKAHPVNSLPLSCRRVKLYEMDANSDAWVDKGTGFCLFSTAHGENSETFPRLEVELENEGVKYCITSNVLLNSDYSSQNDTIIIWNEGGDSSLYRALSFQNILGHNACWAYIQSLVDKSSIDQDSQNIIPADAKPIDPSVKGSYRILVSPITNGVQKLESTIEALLNQSGLADLVYSDLLDKAWLRELFTCMHAALQVQDLGTLTCIASVLFRLVLNWCGNLELMHVFVSDEFYFDLLVAFQYDEELLSQQMVLDHVDFFKNCAKYHCPIDVSNTNIHQLVHENYRMCYLKDVVLPRHLDEFSIQRLNSTIYANTSEVLAVILAEGRGFFEALRDNLSRNFSCALLLRELLVAAKGNQMVSQPDRISLLLMIRHYSLLNELRGYLDETAPAIEDYKLNILPQAEIIKEQYANSKSALAQADLETYRPNLLAPPRSSVMDPTSLVVEIFYTCLEVFPSIVRSAIFCDAEANTSPKILIGFCHVLATFTNQSVQTQVREILIKLLDPKNMDLPEKDEICSLFYDKGIVDELCTLVATPILQPINGQLPSIHVQEARRHAKVCAMDIFSLCAKEHKHRFKVRMHKHNLLVTILEAALNPFDKFVAVGAMKFINTCIKMKDPQVERDICKHNILRSVLWLIQKHTGAGRDGGSILESVCLAVLSTIETSGLDQLLAWIFEDAASAKMLKSLKSSYSHTIATGQGAGGSGLVFSNLERMYKYGRCTSVKKHSNYIDPDGWFDEESDAEAVDADDAGVDDEVVEESDGDVSGQDGGGDGLRAQSLPFRVSGAEPLSILKGSGGALDGTEDDQVFKGRLGTSTSTTTHLTKPLRKRRSLEAPYSITASSSIVIGASDHSSASPSSSPFASSANDQTSYSCMQGGDPTSPQVPKSHHSNALVHGYDDDGDFTISPKTQKPARKFKKISVHLKSPHNSPRSATPTDLAAEFSMDSEQDDDDIDGIDDNNVQVEQEEYRQDDNDT